MLPNLWIRRFLVGVGIAAVTAGAGTADDLGARLDAFVEPYLAAGHLSGSLLVARGDDVLVERSWGWADPVTQRPTEANTPLPIASITKPLTIILAFRLQEEGLLSHDDSLTGFLPDFPHGDDILVKHLIWHRSGLPHLVTDRDDENVVRDPSA